jgi:PAS domain S-box-containing protein
MEVALQLGNSRMAVRIREKDWSSTTLPACKDWPPELTTTLGLILESAFPHYLAWGDDLLSFFNDACEGALGHKPDALGRPFPEVWPEVWQDLAPLIQAAMAGKASFRENMRLFLDRGAGSEETWWTFSYSPVRDANGRVAGVLCTVWETTKLMLAERDAVRQADEFKRFSSLVPELLWVTRVPHEVAWANQRMIDFLGVDPTTIGSDWPSLVHPDDAHAIDLRFEKALAQRKTLESRHRLRRADGSYRWVLVRARPVAGPDDVIEGWYSAATDIHDWHLAAESMHFKEELFETFARSSHKVLWIVDVATRRIDYMAGDTEHLWGKGMAGRVRSWDDWFETIHPEDRDQHLDYLPRLQSGELIHAEYRLTGYDGRIRNVRETLFAVPNAEGEISRVGGIAESIDAEDLRQVYLVGFEPALETRLTTPFWRQGWEPKAFASVEQFVKIAAALQPGAILLNSPGAGVGVGRIFGALGPRRSAFRILILTPAHDGAQEVRSFMKAGAFDVLPQNGGGEERLLRVVRDALHELTTSPASSASGGQHARERLAALSPREREVLGRLVKGLSNKLIAK